MADRRLRTEYIIFLQVLRVFHECYRHLVELAMVGSLTLYTLGKVIDMDDPGRTFPGSVDKLVRTWTVLHSSTQRSTVLSRLRWLRGISFSLIVAQR